MDLAAPFPLRRLRPATSARGAAPEAAPPRRGRARHRSPRRVRRVLLIGAGTHAATLAAQLQGLPEDADLVVVLRMATREDRTSGAELAELTLRRGGRLVELRGAQSAVALDAARLASLVGDVAGREVHVAGPRGFARAALAAAGASGVPAARCRTLV